MASSLLLKSVGKGWLVGGGGRPEEKGAASKFERRGEKDRNEKIDIGGLKIGRSDWLDVEVELHRANGGKRGRRHRGQGCKRRCRAAAGTAASQALCFAAWYLH